VILLLPPQLNDMAAAEIRKTLALFRLSRYEEIEPRAGCRRFRLF